MNIQEIIDTVNKGLAVDGHGPFESSNETESFHRTVVRGTLAGRDISVEIDEDDETSEYQVSITLRDLDTDQPIGRGNGGPTLQDAGSIFQWKNAVSDLKLL
ncbi:hypothetical protein QN355_06535 [Cryobacterium sp. 10S3]|uniref:hypothetical protein n=1 Tax=Cryobacterium sp. 10S3 TaxID=3048582 RepID=UPI002AC8C6CA|nr:hypothetical protein [Cryobacterium sp. 10S3]MEB0286205.1 hypothetical protein [Cryobacterium sp. 10S3]WPX12263.1 hypothetical protein RHM57_11275 [Cryobacterium sp. 10S3]